MPVNNGLPHRAVIFDCDGTLVDSERIGVEVLLDVAREHGAILGAETLPPGPPQAASEAEFIERCVRRLRGLSMAECLAELERLGQFRFPRDVEASIRELTARAFRERLLEMPGATQFVRGLQLPFCVASSGPRAKIELSLSLTGLLPFFDGKIFSSYDIGSWKPEPHLFLHAAQTLGVAPEQCAVIEDSQPGVDAGVAAGMWVYAFGEAPLQLPEHARGVRVRSYLELELEFRRWSG